jgi:hypothetical protein
MTPKLLLSSTSALSTSWHVCLISEIFVSSAAFLCEVNGLLLMPRSTRRFYSRTYWEDDGAPYQQAERLERGCGLEFESMRNSGVESPVTISGNHTNGLCSESQTPKNEWYGLRCYSSCWFNWCTLHHALRAEEHQEIAGRYVIIDPGRRDLLSCVHENSTPQEPHTFRYTSSYEKKMRKTTKYRRFELAVKEDNTLCNRQNGY